MVALHRKAGGEAAALTRAGWSFSAVGKDGDGHVCVLDTTNNAGVSHGWKLDAKGNYIGETVFDEGNATAGEALFQIDMNADGKVAAPLPQLVTKNGGLKLMVDPSNGAAMIELEDGSCLTITRGGPNDAVKLD